MTAKNTTPKTVNSKKRTVRSDTKSSNGQGKGSRKRAPKTANELMREAWEYTYANRDRRLDR
jgi:hypothetical protein